MPVAQFDQFEKLDQPVMRFGGEVEAREFWNKLSDEQNSYLDGGGGRGGGKGGGRGGGGKEGDDLMADLGDSRVDVTASLATNRNQQTS